MIRVRASIAIVIVACASREPPPDDCADLALLPTGTSLAAAREAHRRGALRQELRYRDALEPGYTVRATAAIAQPGACLADLYEAGRLLFEHSFDHVDGLASPARRVQLGRRGGPDATSCTSCHSRGGRGGGGSLADAAYMLGDGDRASSADARNPLALGGAGAVQAIAAQLTGDLRALRANAIARARITNARVDVELVASGVSFGILHVAPDRVDTRDVLGVDADLVVRPFGWKGTAATVTDFVAESAALHFGVTSADALHAREPIAVPFVRADLTPRQIIALALYVASLDAPIAAVATDHPYRRDLVARGRAVFEQFGCAGCHVPRLVLRSPIVAIRSAATGATVALDLSRDIEAPRFGYDAALGGYPVDAFSDFKRHDLGEANASRHRQSGIATRLYLTRRLWGVADSAPYFHDGESPSIDHAIARHGGEALFARESWSGASADDRNALRLFLASLRRAAHVEVP